MTPLDYSQREMMSRSIVHAVARERQRHAAAADELHAAIARERDEMLAEMAKIKADMLAPFFAMQAELERIRKEAALLREWRDAHVAHKQARQELLELYQRRALERAQAAEFDPVTMSLQ